MPRVEVIMPNRSGHEKASFKLKIKPNEKGQGLFDEVVNYLGIREVSNSKDLFLGWPDPGFWNIYAILFS